MDTNIVLAMIVEKIIIINFNMKDIPININKKIIDFTTSQPKQIINILTKINVTMIFSIDYKTKRKYKININTLKE